MESGADTHTPTRRRDVHTNASVHKRLDPKAAIEALGADGAGDPMAPVIEALGADGAPDAFDALAAESHDAVFAAGSLGSVALFSCMLHAVFDITPRPSPEM